MTRRLLVLLCACLFAIVAAGSGIARLKGSPPPPSPFGPLAVPYKVQLKMKHAVTGGHVYVPTFVPKGYRYLTWKLESSNPRPGDKWYSITFRKGKPTLRWEVDRADATPCSEGSDSSNGAGTYFSFTHPGEAAWRCLKSGGRRLVVYVFDNARPVLGSSSLVEMLDSMYRA